MQINLAEREISKKYLQMKDDRDDQSFIQVGIPWCTYLVKVWLYRSITKQSSGGIIQITAFPP